MSHSLGKAWSSGMWFKRSAPAWVRKLWQLWGVLESSRIAMLRGIFVNKILCCRLHDLANCQVSAIRAPVSRPRISITPLRLNGASELCSVVLNFKQSYVPDRKNIVDSSHRECGLLARKMTSSGVYVTKASRVGIIPPFEFNLPMVRRKLALSNASIEALCQPDVDNVVSGPPPLRGETNNFISLTGVGEQDLRWSRKMPRALLLWLQVLRSSVTRPA